ncbi:hypothetical protein GCM10010442_54010 [Kitasatospora kifunensis]
MAARARTWRLKFLWAVIAAFHALSDGPPATSPEAIGLRLRPETLVPLPPMGDRAGDGRGRFGVGHAVPHDAVDHGLRQSPTLIGSFLGRLFPGSARSWIGSFLDRLFLDLLSERTLG